MAKGLITVWTMADQFIYLLASNCASYLMFITELFFLFFFLTWLIILIMTGVGWNPYQQMIGKNKIVFKFILFLCNLKANELKFTNEL